MSNAAEILVIILSVFLALFLLLAIILTVLLIRVTKQIRQVANKADNIAGHVNQFAMNATKFSSPALIGKFVFDQVRKMRK